MPTSVTLADADATDSTKALYAYLQGLDAADQVLFGHQNDTHKHTGTNDGVYSDTKDVTGSISGVVGIDSLALTGVELGLTDVDEAIAESVRISKEAAAEGAIITLSTHMPNMSDSKIVATPDAKYITIPFDQLKGKNGGTFDPKSVTKFAVWCNSIPANGATDIESSIVFDDIQFINVDTSTLNIQNGYAITDESLAPVEKEETSIKLNKTTARVKKGKTLQLKATVTPSDMTVTWKSSNTKVATVSKEDIRKIAETKMPDLNAVDIEGAMSMIAGTARSMGIVVED